MTLLKTESDLENSVYLTGVIHSAIKRGAIPNPLNSMDLTWCIKIFTNLLELILNPVLISSKKYVRLADIWSRSLLPEFPLHPETFLAIDLYRHLSDVPSERFGITQSKCAG